MIDLFTELKGVLQALEAASVPYALCGGLALMDQNPDTFRRSQDA